MPFRVVSVRGNKAVLEDLNDLDGLHGAKKQPGVVSARRFEGHIEDMVLCPPDAEDLEQRPELEMEDASETPQSVGEIVEASDRQKHDHFTLKKKGRQFIIRSGEFVAYQTGHGKVCRVGKVKSVSTAEESVTLHPYGPIVGGLRVVWMEATLPCWT